MKKIITIFTALFLMAAFASCGKDNPDEPNSGNQGNPDIVWFADWVDIRGTGNDTALFDKRG